MKVVAVIIMAPTTVTSNIHMKHEQTLSPRKITQHFGEIFPNNQSNYYIYNQRSLRAINTVSTNICGKINSKSWDLHLKRSLSPNQLCDVPPKPRQCFRNDYYFSGTNRTFFLIPLLLWDKTWDIIQIGTTCMKRIAYVPSQDICSLHPNWKRRSELIW